MVTAAVAVASAPGRVTLLGEHTDYNGGRSLGVAMEPRTRAAAERPRAGGRVEVVSSVLGAASCPIDQPTGPPFVRIAAALAVAAGWRGGVRLLVDSDLPVGAGLSSSAAYAVATALALGVPGSILDVAVACRAAEAAAGSDVGLLDQLVVLAARRGEVVALDFAGPTVEHVGLHPAIGLSIVDTGVRRTVAQTAYGERRAACAAAAARIGMLGRATLADLAGLDDGELRRRARHVVTECARVDEASACLRDGALERFGTLLDEGHASLRDDFEVSTPDVERARDEVRALPGVAGVRLTGAGFGGWLVVAHDPDVTVAPPGRSSSRLEPAEGARVSAR
jgi:galactokinase